MKKLMNMMLIIAFILCNCFVAKVYAEGANVCTIDESFSKDNVKPGEQVELSILATEINEAIAGVGFTLNYDSSVIEFVELNNANGWTISKTENLFTIFTNNFEATSTTGKVGGIILKVKNGTEATNTDIKLTSVQVTKDDTTSVNLNVVTKKLSIDQTTSEDNNNNQQNTNETGNTTNGSGNSQSGNSQSGNTTNGSGNSQSGNSQSENTTNGSGNSQSENTTNGSGNSQSENTTNENGNNQNENTTNGSENNQNENTTNNKTSLPYTGNFTIMWAILLVIALVAIISLIKYKKYKKI